MSLEGSNAAIIGRIPDFSRFVATTRHEEDAIINNKTIHPIRMGLNTSLVFISISPHLHNQLFEQISVHGSFHPRNQQKGRSLSQQASEEWISIHVLFLHTFLTQYPTPSNE